MVFRTVMTDGTVSRRRMISAMAAAGVLGLSGCADGDTEDGSDGDDGGDGDDGSDGGTQGTATDVSGTVRIGVLQPLSGDLAYYGQQAIWGFASGLAHKTETDPLEDIQTGTRTVEDGDVTYELVIRDTEFSASTAQNVATNLVQNEDVDMLFGTSNSGAAAQVSQTVVNTDQVDIPFMVGPAASASLTNSSETCSDQLFRASENTAMDARSGGTYVAEQTDVERVFLMGADYSFGRAVVNNYEAVLQERGVEIVGKRFVPQGYDDFGGIFDTAVDANADAAVGGFTVATLPNFMTTAANYDIRIFGGFATEITNTVVGGVLQNILGDLTAEKIENAEIGPFTTRYHWNQYDNSINESFVESYTNAYGKVPDLFTSGTFTAASATVQAVRQTGSTDGVDLIDGLTGMTVTDTPKGENGYTFQEHNNQARSEMTIAYPVPTEDQWSDNWGAAIQPGEPLARIDADNTTIPESESDCSL
jgi:branched-chain amino acid transport system substrate-binding protein